MDTLIPNKIHVDLNPMDLGLAKMNMMTCIVGRVRVVRYLTMCAIVRVENLISGDTATTFTPLYIPIYTLKR